MKRRIGRWLTALRGRYAAKAAILMYHRVAVVDEDPWELCVSPGRFDEQLSLLARDHRVVPLDTLVAEVRDRRLRPGTVAITFDDGYADNLEVAAPLLARHGLPATFFLTSSLIGSASGFWWDRLGQLLLGNARLPERLELAVDGTARQWDLGAAAAPPGPAPRSARGPRPWEADPASRLGFFYDVWKYLRQLSPPQRELALGQIEAWRGTGPSSVSTQRILTAAEARELAGRPGMSIGAHSASHAALSSCAVAEQRAEIGRSRQELERLVGGPVTAFAYPFGDFGPETPGLVREAGYDSACIADPGCVWAGTDPYVLPRLAALDWTAAELRRELERCLQ
jgi:peptidoglycan/xylan/chitin deacetylase (PgdA/CDA1 family)